MRLDNKQCEAIVRLESSPDYQVLHEAMNAYRHELLEMVMYGQEDTVQTYRGMARATSEIMRSLGSARKQLEKAQKH